MVMTNQSDQEWFYATVENGRYKQHGPLNQGDLQELISNRAIEPISLVWNSALDDWVKYEEAGFKLPTNPPPLPSLETEVAVEPESDTDPDSLVINRLHCCIGKGWVLPSNGATCVRCGTVLEWGSFEKNG